jgi:hypothetical protein
MNAEHEEAVEFAKISKRENRVYVGNLSYEVKYRDLMEFMRGGGLGNSSLFRCCIFWIGSFLGSTREGGVVVIPVFVRAP